MEQSVLRPHRGSIGPLAPPIGSKRPDSSSSLGFWPVLSNSDKNVATLLSTVVYPVQTLKPWSKLSSAADKVKKQNKKEKKGKERKKTGEGRKVTRGEQNLCQDLWKLHPLPCSQHGMSTTHSATTTEPKASLFLSATVVASCCQTVKQTVSGSVI